MTDDLRTRIAAALRQLHNGRDAEKCADAVIRELGLKRVEMGEWDVLAYGFRGFCYATEWETDD